MRWIYIGRRAFAPLGLSAFSSFEPVPSMLQSLGSIAGLIMTREAFGGWVANQPPAHLGGLCAELGLDCTNPKATLLARVDGLELPAPEPEPEPVAPSEVNEGHARAFAMSEAGETWADIAAELQVGVATAKRWAKKGAA